MKVSELNSIYPALCPIVLDTRKQYADWNCYLDYGYICYNKNSVKLLEHRLVADTAYGLSRHQHVHHKDECKTNNAADNLIPVSNRMHGLLHGRNGWEIIQCHQCNKRFRIKKSVTERKDREHQKYFFCSPGCASTHNQLGRRGIQRPDRETLIADLQALRNWSAVGRKYGVSDNGIRSWVRRYGIDASHIDGRK